MNGHKQLLRKKQSGQMVVEYLLTTLFMAMFFVAMYGFLQGQLKKLFIKAGMAILTAYY